MSSSTTSPITFFARSVARIIAKFIWELADAHLTGHHPSPLHEGYEEYLNAWSPLQRSSRAIGPLQDGIKKAGVTQDDEIAHCLARFVTEVVRTPYFEYRDFVPRYRRSMLPEGEEAPYFRAILKTIKTGLTARGTAFVIDEFEEIALQERLTRRVAHDYLVTLQRLVNLVHDKEVKFWLVLSMTPDAYATTESLAPSLLERISGNRVQIAQLSWPEARSLLVSRLRAARPTGFESANGPLFPFPSTAFFRPTTYGNPRRLVKSCFGAIARADATTKLPFPEAYLRGVEDKLYPSAAGDRGRS